MTTLQDTDRMTAGVPTDLGTTYSIRDLQQIEDVIELARAAAAVARETEERGDAARHLRDIGGLLMIQPFQNAQRPYDAEIGRIDDLLEAGKIRPAEARTLKQVASDRRRAPMGDVVYKPIDVYQKTIGVSRGLFVRMQHRAAQLPTPEEYMAGAGEPVDGMVSLEQVAEVARAKRDECILYDAINKEARTIRDDAIRKLLKGNRRAKLPKMTSADVARLTLLTTPRVAQIKKGYR